MNVLFLGDQAFDYVSDPLYIGLSRVLGEASVVDFPYKHLYHDPESKNWFVVQRPGPRYERQAILDLLRAKYFDLACIASFRAECLDELQQLYGTVPFPPMVFIDGADDGRIRHEVVRQYPIALYFKRDYLWGDGRRFGNLGALAYTFRGDRALFSCTVPLPISIVLDAISNPGVVAKTVDVSYTGRASHSRRIRAVKILSGMKGVRFEGGVYAEASDRKYKLKAGMLERLGTKLLDNAPASEGDQLKKKLPSMYYEEIARSKIALAIRGGGWTPSPRYYEIVAMKTLLISDVPEAVIPDNFVHKRHAVFCRPDLRDLESSVRYYLREEREREAIVTEGYAHLLKHHTCERRAEYFIDVCRQKL